MGAIVEEACFDVADVREIIAGTRGFGMVGRYADRMDVHRDRMTAQLINQVTDALKLDVRGCAPRTGIACARSSRATTTS